MKPQTSNLKHQGTSKLQAPTSKHQRNPKLQISKTCGQSPSKKGLERLGFFAMPLELVSWSFSGAWRLELGSSAARLLLAWGVISVCVALSPLAAADARR